MQSIQPGGSGERKRGIDPSISSSSELTLEDEDHSVEDGDGDGDAAAREANLVSPGQRQTSFVRSTSASTSRAAQKNAHATYGRSTSFVSKSDKNSIRPLPIDFSSDAEDSVSDSSTKANRSLNALALVPSRKQTWDDDVNRGRGWTLPKLFAWAHDDGGEKGLWETGVWDVEVMDPPIGDPKAKYLPLGTWVDGITPASGTELESKEEDQAMEVEATVKGTKAGEEDVKMTSPTHESASAPNAENFPTSTWSHSSRRRPWRTLTRVELEQARPHPYAYYSRPDHSWCIFAPLRSSSSSSATPRDQSQPDLWHWGPSMSFHDLPGPSLSLPIPAADPASIPPMYSEKKKTTLNQVSGGLKGLKGLRSLSGRTAIISENSNWYPSVIPRELWDDFVKKFEGFPSNGEGKNDPATGAVNVVFRAIDALLFKGQYRSIPLTGTTFSKYFSDFNPVARNVFHGILGFSIDDQAKTLSPPQIDEDTEDGKLNRRRLARAWLELAIWLQDRRERGFVCGGAIRVKLTQARIVLIPQLGGDHYERSKAAFSEWPTVSSSVEYNPAASAYNDLGVVPTFSDAALIAVYEEQKKCDSKESSAYLTALEAIARIRPSDALQIHVAAEKSQGRFTQTDLQEAYRTIESRNTSSEDDIAASFHRTWSRSTAASEKRRVREAMQLIIKARDDSEMLQAVLLSLGDELQPKMEYSRAMKLLDLDQGSEVNDEMILTVYSIRVADSPTEADTMREALSVIAAQRDSEHIRRFLKTGSPNDVEDVSMGTDRPVGLTNIANTCYLNSLLQYFFTIRELRDAILTFHAPAEASEVDQLQRVGGRLVTVTEVDRSRRFVLLLQALFNQLIHTSTSSVTPETELAYLALVPSKEETDAKISSGVSDFINPTTDDPVTSPLARSPTVLGKRAIDALDDVGTSQSEAGQPVESIDDAMAVDLQPDRNRRSPTLVEGVSPKMPRGDDLSAAGAEEFSATEGADGVIEIGLSPVDIEMTPPPPPPLPARPTAKKPDLEKEVSSYMAFGRQNDVTECMDNVMFQIEAALSSTRSGDAEAESLLKRTFYGKMRQQLQIDDPGEKEPLRIKEEPFFSLLVDVAEEGRDVYDGLDTVFDDSIVDIEGKHARRRISLVAVPSLLQIQLQRVQYNRLEQKIFKSNAHMSFSDTISMDRYLEIDPEDVAGIARRDRTIELRQQIEASRSRLTKLTTSKDLDIAKLFGEVQAHLADLPELFSDDLLPEEGDFALKESYSVALDISSLTAELASLREHITRIWSDQHKATFELVSVFIHRGTALSGHYYIYIRDSKSPSRWLKYNDSVVTNVSTEEVFRATNSDTNPYFLVYARRDRLDAVDTICRSA